MSDMKDAIIAGNDVLLNEQAVLLRECRAALDDLFAKKPGIERLICGSTTLGNLRAELGKPKPKAVMGKPEDCRAIDCAGSLAPMLCEDGRTTHIQVCSKVGCEYTPST